MFIHIEEARSPATINLILKRMKKQEREFLPKDMLVFLRVTNHHLSIRDMLKNIPEGKEAEFKEAICSMAEHREHTDANLERMREIAKIGGFEAEFEEAHAKEKLIGNTFGKTFIAASVEDLEKKTDLSSYGTVICDFDGYKTSVNADSRIFIAKSNKDLQANPDLTKYDMVICNFKGSTEFADLTKLPKRMIIKGNIDWRYRDFEKLPDISESIIYGSFYCSLCENLTSLEGAPKEVGGVFYCKSCDKLEESGIYLVQDGQYYDVFNLPKDKEFVINGDLYISRYSFKRLPDLSNVIVKGNFNCSWCENLTSLEGAPKEVGGDFSCWTCKNLTSLKGAPEEVGRYFNCSWCENLTSLEGAPKEVGGDFSCWACKNLTSAKGLPAKIGGKIECDKMFNIAIALELTKNYLFSTKLLNRD